MEKKARLSKQMTSKSYFPIFLIFFQSLYYYSDTVAVIMLSVSTGTACNDAMTTLLNLKGKYYVFVI